MTGREHAVPAGCWPVPGAAGGRDGGHAAGLEPSVRQLMLTVPTTLPSDATVADAREVLADDHVHMVLLTDGDLLRGTVVREDLPSTVAGTDPATRHARLAGRTIAPDAPEGEARRLLEGTGARRLAVVDDDLRLRGLLCLKRHGRGYCSDADVAARAATRAGPAAGSPAPG